MLFAIAALFLKSGLSFPYPFTNSTHAGHGISSNQTAISPTNLTTQQYRCDEVYPFELTVINERYPDYNISHLHEAKKFFMLRRELRNVGEIATVVHFKELPSLASNTTCRLEFVLPEPKLQRIYGSNPTFNVHQVEGHTELIATWQSWQTYQGNTGAELFGRVNGQPEALERTRSVGGVAAINETMCNETMTFQMGMAYNSRDGVPNYWEFTNVAPPAWPPQGFRIVHGC